MRWKQIETDMPGVSCWVLTDWVRTEFDFEAPGVSLISEGGGDLELFDLAFIEETLAGIDGCFHKAIEYLKAALKNDPAPFKLGPEALEKAREDPVSGWYRLPDNDVEKYAGVPAHEFPVNQPDIVFYTDGDWLIRFGEAAFPAAAHGRGIAVSFDKSREITGFDILGR